MKDSLNGQKVILNSIGDADAVIATDTRGGITRMNPVACQLTGWTGQEVLGWPLELFLTCFPVIKCDSLEKKFKPL